MIHDNFIKIYENSFRDNWDLPAVTDYGTTITFYYRDVAAEIARMHIVFKENDIQCGDKIALVGKDCSRWIIAFMATITYGAVIVPILQDFSPDDIHHIINHSDAVFLFVSDQIWESLEEDKMPAVKAFYSLYDFLPINKIINEKNICKENIELKMRQQYPGGFSPDHVVYPDINNNNVVEINYTSGTTGFSKGVMLTGNNLAGNVTYAKTLNLMFREDKELCFLPLAHAYSCAFNLLTPLAVGAHVYVLGKIPSPKILLKAFKEIRPHLIITVPLILEKIYKNIILPQLNRKALKLALNIPLLDRRIYDKINKQLIDALGGRFCEVIVGGGCYESGSDRFFM